MDAIIETSGRQYSVKPGDTIKVDSINAATGSDIEFDKVVLLNNGENIQVGTPCVSGAKVVAHVLEHGKDKKIKIVKFKRRKHHMKTMGYRHSFTKLQIKEIIV